MAYQQFPVLKSGLNLNCPRYDISAIKLVSAVVAAPRASTQVPQTYSDPLVTAVWSIVEHFNDKANKIENSRPYELAPAKKEALARLMDGSFTTYDLSEIQKLLTQLKQMKFYLKLDYADMDEQIKNAENLLQKKQCDENKSLQSIPEDEKDFITDCKDLYAAIKETTKQRLSLLKDPTAENLSGVKAELMRSIMSQDLKGIFIQKISLLEVRLKKLQLAFNKVQEHCPYTDHFFIGNHEQDAAMFSKTQKLFCNHKIIPLEVSQEALNSIYKNHTWGRLRNNPNDIAPFICNFDNIIEFYFQNGISNPKKITKCYRMSNLLNSFAVEAADKKVYRLPTFLMKCFIAHLIDSHKKNSQLEVDSLEPVFIKAFAMAMLAMNMGDLEKLINTTLASGNTPELEKLLKFFNNTIQNNYGMAVNWIKILGNRDNIFLKTIAINFLLVLNLMVKNNCLKNLNATNSMIFQAAIQIADKNLASYCLTLNERSSGSIVKYYFINLSGFCLDGIPVRQCLNLSYSCLRSANLVGITDSLILLHCDLANATFSGREKITPYFTDLPFPDSDIPNDLISVNAVQYYPHLLGVTGGKTNILTQGPTLAAPPPLIKPQGKKS